MKKAVKITTMLMAFMLIMLIGCKNSFVSTNVGSDAFKDEIRADNNSLTYLIVETMQTPVAVDKNHRFAVEFNLPVTEKVKDAVSFYELTDADSDDKAPKLSTKTLQVVDFKLSGTTAYFWVSTDTVKHVYVRVKASAVQGINGQYMNQDYDTKWAEADDDDYVEVFALSGILKGKQNYLDMGSKNQVLTNKNIEVQFTQNTKDNPDLGSHINEITVKYDYESLGLSKDAVEGIIKNHIRVEQYTKDDSWKEITPNFTYNDTNKNWTAALALGQNTQVRYKIINTDTIPALKSSKYLYDIKYTKDSNLAKTIFYKPVPTGLKEDFVSWDLSNTHTLNINEAKTTVVFTLTPDKLKFKKYIDKTQGAKEVTPKIVSGKYESFKGFVDETLTLDKFKAYATMQGFYKKEKGLWANKSGKKYYFKLTLTLDAYKYDTQLIFNRIVTAPSDFTLYPSSLNNSVELYISPASKQYVDLSHNAKIWYPKLKQIYNTLKKKPANDSSYDFTETILKDFYYDVVNRVKYRFGVAELDDENKAFVQRLIRDFLADIIEEGYSNETDNDERGLEKMLECQDSIIDIITDFYVSPELKTAPLTGVYIKDDGTSADIEIPSLSFVKYAPSDDPNTLNGWVRVE